MRATRSIDVAFGPRATLVRAMLIGALAASTAIVTGCATQRGTGAAVGGGIGAIAGQIIGGNTEATLIGSAVGAGIGYIIGNERDRERARAARADQMRQMTAPLGGTRWEVLEWSPREERVAFRTKVVEFRTNGEVVTTTTFPNGASQIDNESYRVVDDTLVVNKPGYMVNYRFSFAGDRLNLTANRVRATLRRI